MSAQRFGPVWDTRPSELADRATPLSRIPEEGAPPVARTEGPPPSSAGPDTEGLWLDPGRPPGEPAYVPGSYERALSWCARQGFDPAAPLPVEVQAMRDRLFRGSQRHALAQPDSLLGLFESTDAEPRPDAPPTPAPDPEREGVSRSIIECIDASHRRHDAERD